MRSKMYTSFGLVTDLLKYLQEPFGLTSSNKSNIRIVNFEMVLFKVYRTHDYTESRICEIWKEGIKS